MGRLQTKTADSDYSEYDRGLNGQFIHGLDNKGMISEILKEVAVLKVIHYTTSELVQL